MSIVKSIPKNAMRGLKATGGGLASRIVTNKIATMIPMVKDYPKFHGALAYALGAAVADKWGDVGIGMMAVAGTDTVGKFVPMFSGSGIGDDILETLADELADELEDGIEDDVQDAEASMNDDDDTMNDDDDTMNDDDDYSVNDDVSSPGASMNAV